MMEVREWWLMRVMKGGGGFEKVRNLADASASYMVFSRGVGHVCEQACLDGISLFMEVSIRNQCNARKLTV